nr:hypothetical protein [Tanacetum cinerariifolium]
AYCGEPSVDLLQSFLNLGHACDWLTLSNRGGVVVPKALIKPGGFEDNQGSFFVKSVNNTTPILDVEPISTVLLANVADNIIDSNNTSFDDELPPMHSLRWASKVAGDASSPLDINSDPDIHEFPSIKELKDATDCRWERLKASEIKILQEIDRNEMGVLIARLVREAIIHGRCMAFEEIAKLKEPFVLEKMPGYRMSLKDENDQAREDMANALLPFLY